MKKYLAVIYLLILNLNATSLTLAQGTNVAWANSLGGPYVESGNAITTDDFGNVYSTGFFTQTVDFDPGIGVFNLSSTGTGYGVYITKFNSQGNLIWAKSIGGDNLNNSYCIKVDAVGNVYIGGIFYNSIDFDPGSGVYNLSGNGAGDIFILKLDFNGNFIWAKQIGGNSGDYCKSFAFDSNGNLLASGQFSNDADFDPGVGVFNLTGAGVFLLKLDSSGNFIWAKKMGGIGYFQNSGIAIDNMGNIYTTGSFQGTMDFDPGSGIFNITSNPLYDIFISKLDSAGNFLWAKSVGGTDNDHSYSLAVDNTGNSYSTGKFSGLVDFDPGTGINNLTGDGGYALKLDSNGSFVWAKQLGEVGWSLTLDTNFNVFTGGYYDGNDDFDPGTGTYVLNFGNLFISKLDSAGNFAAAFGFGGTVNEDCRGIAVDNSNSLYATGFYNGTANFDPGASNFSITSVGFNDVFIAKFDISTGIENLKNNDDLIIYPNPATNQFYISLVGKTKNVEITIHDMAGKLQYKSMVDELQPTIINTQNLSNGIYHVRLIASDLIRTEKLMISK